MITGIVLNEKMLVLNIQLMLVGLDWFVDELHTRLGWKLEPARAYHFDHNGDRYGWVKGSKGKWHFTLFIQSGRIKDLEDYQLMTGLREIAKIHSGEFPINSEPKLGYK